MDELVDTLEKLQNRQAALAEQVRVVKAPLAKKAAAQAERMKKPGVEEIQVPRTTDPLPPRRPIDAGVTRRLDETRPIVEEKPAAAPGEEQADRRHMKFLPRDQVVRQETSALPSVEPK